MPRIARVAPGGLVYHVVNRANGKLNIFRKDEDFKAFFRCVDEAMKRHPIRILSWCVMNNHWHFVVWPREDTDLSRFFGHLSLLHATRWQASHNAVGSGHVYQGRFRNFMIQQDEHLQRTLRYVERNPVRAGMVSQAEKWRWSSLHAWANEADEYRELLSEWPIERPRNWIKLVNTPLTDAEIEAIRTCGKRGRPYGNETWTKQMATRHDLVTTLRPRGRQPGWRKAKTK